MIKVFVLIKRKSGMSMEDFIAYYESNHAVLAKKNVPNLKKYVRHYLHPFGNEVYSADDEPDVDVVTEVWFDDQKDFEQGMAYLTDEAIAKIIGDDEDILFEKATIRYHIVEDHETDMKI
jgi:uncharacterized protein (TIGR02118 family)